MDFARCLCAMLSLPTSSSSYSTYNTSDLEPESESRSFSSSKKSCMLFVVCRLLFDDALPFDPLQNRHFSFTSYLTLFLPLLCVYHTQARHRVEMGTFLPNRYLSEVITWSKSKLERVNNDVVSLCRGNDDIDVFKWISEKPPFLVKRRHECHDRQ